MDDVRPLVTQDSTIEAHELKKLMMCSFFQPSDEGDSYQTQELNHEDAYERTALMLLSSTQDALKSTLANVMHRYAIHEIPQGMTATIRIKHGEPMQISLEEEEAEEG